MHLLYTMNDQNQAKDVVGPILGVRAGVRARVRRAGVRDGVRVRVRTRVGVTAGIGVGVRVVPWLAYFLLPTIPPFSAKLRANQLQLIQVVQVILENSSSEQWVGG